MPFWPSIVHQFFCYISLYIGFYLYLKCGIDGSSHFRCAFFTKQPNRCRAVVTIIKSIQNHVQSIRQMALACSCGSASNRRASILACVSIHLCLARAVHTILPRTLSYRIINHSIINQINRIKIVQRAQSIRIDPILGKNSFTICI